MEQFIKEGEAATNTALKGGDMINLIIAILDVHDFCKLYEKIFGRLFARIHNGPSSFLKKS
jgi:hypothetical protein